MSQIEFKQNVLRDLPSLGTVVITDDTVKNLYLKECPLPLFSFPGGELYKSRESKQKIEDGMLLRGLGSEAVVIAIGGGIVTDLAGFVASTYCRGIPLKLIPTTLLAMVDSSIGGKNGVNVPQGKNLIGTLYEPKKIYIDTLFLDTLPEKEKQNGIVEMIKHGLICDANYFKNFEHAWHVDEKSIHQSHLIKNKIIREGPERRHLLNFGHTIGHAIETVTNYQVSHGEAVAIGIVVESYLSMQIGILPKNSFERILKIFLNFHLSKPLSIDLMKEAMKRDKKNLGGDPRFVILEEIGLANQCKAVDEDRVNESLEWMNHVMCGH